MSQRRVNRRMFLMQIAAGGASLALLAACAATEPPRPQGAASSSAAPAGSSAAGSSSVPAASGSTSMAASASSSAASGTAKPGVVEIDLLTFYLGPDGKVMQGLVDKFNASQDKIRVKYQAPGWGAEYVTKLQTASLSGKPPAVVALHSWEIPALRQFMYDFGPIAKDLGIKQEDFQEIAWNLPVYEGTRWGVTLSTGTLGLFWNKDLFKKAGLDPEKPPTDTDSFIETAKKLTKPEENQWGTIWDPIGWLPWWTWNWRAGGELLTPDNKKTAFNSEAGIAALQLEVDLVRKHKVAPPNRPLDGPEAERIWFSGKIGLYLSGPWNLPKVFEYKNNNQGDFGWTYYPKIFTKADRIQSTNHTYHLFKAKPENGAARDAGAQFIRWLLYEGSTEWARAQAPVNKKVVDAVKNNPDPGIKAMSLFIEQGEKAAFQPAIAPWFQIAVPLREAREKAIYQGADPKTVFKDVAEKGDAILASS